VAAPISLPADGDTSSTITVTVLDFNSNPISGATVTLDSDRSTDVDTIFQPVGTTNANGQITGFVSSTSAGTSTISAIVNGTININNMATVSFTVGDPDPTRSTVVAAPISVPADGDTSSTITVTVRDFNNNPISGATVTLSSDREEDTIFQPVGTTDANGQITGFVSSTGAGTSTISAIVNGTVTVVDTATVTFLNPPILISVSPTRNNTSVPSDTNISATFDQDVNNASSNTFVVHGDMTGTLSGTYSGNATPILEFNPLFNFKPGEKIQATLTTGIQSVLGSPIVQPHTWEFRVGSPLGPANFNKVTNYSTGLGPYAVAASDLDSDGDIDIAAANSEDSNVSILLNDGTGIFGAPTNYSVGIFPESLVTADLDGDGDMDLAAAAFGDGSTANPGEVSVLLNNGNGTFAASVSYPGGPQPFTMATSDLDGDGDFDLIVTNSSGISILLNNGNGTFAAPSNISLPDSGGWVTSGDLDNDGDIDLAVASGPFAETNFLVILLNNGDGTFGPPSPTPQTPPGQLTSGDIDGDGDLDLAVAPFFSTSVPVLLNNGDGTFSTPVNYFIGTCVALPPNPCSIVINGSATFVSFGDLDGDGDLDIAVANSSFNAVTILLNAGDGTFGPTGSAVHYAAGDNPLGIAIADFDGDNDLDIASANNSSNDVSVLINSLPGQLQFSSANYSVDENGVSATISVTRTAGSEGTVAVDFATSDGTATAGQDYTLSSGTLTFDPDVTSQTFNVAILEDSLFEGNETINLTLQNPEGGATLGAQSVSTLTITDNDPAPSISINDVTVTEGNSGTVNAVFTVSLSGASGQTVTVNYATANGSATAGSDYIATNGTLTFLPDETSKTIIVVVNGDTLVEGNETFVVNLTNPTNATILDGQGVGTITNDDTLTTRAYIAQINEGTVFVIDTSIHKGVALVPVGNRPAAIAVNSAGTHTYVTNDADNTVSVINTTNNTVIATVPVGDSPDGGIAVNPAGTRIYVTNLFSDTVSVIDASSNTVIATIPVPVGTRPAGIAVHPDGSRVYVATQGDDNIRIIDTARNSVTASVGVGSFPIGVAVNPTGTRVYVTNLAGNTVSVIDTATNTVVATVSVPSSVSGSRLSGVAVNPAGTRVYVTNLDDNTVSVIDTTTHTVIANVVVGSFPNGVAVDLDGSDVYVVNAFSDTVSVIGTDTNTVRATIGVGGGPNAIAIGPIPPGINVNPTSGLVTTEAGGATTFTVVLNTQPSANVDIALSSSDTSEGTVSPTNLTFTPSTWNVAQTVTVTGVDDLVNDGNIAYTIITSQVVSTDPKYSNLNAADVSVTNNDNDPPPSISINNVTVTEGNTGTVNAIFTVSLSAASGQTVTVNYATADGSATAGTDYVATSGTLTFESGETSKTVIVVVNGDTLNETNETFFLNLTAPTNATIADGQGVGTIINDDIPLSGIVSISAGETAHTCALTTVGGVKCWGDNGFGQLGDGTTTDRLTPVDVVGLTSGVIAISAGGNHTCALTTAGGVKCWGANAFGRLGDGTETQRLTPVDVVGLTSGVSAISAGFFHTCVLTTAGGVRCWGAGGNGRLGDGTQTQRLTPVDVVGLTSGVSAISAGAGGTCALTTAAIGGPSGGVKCWGFNGFGQLGDGTTIDRLTPVDVVGLTSGVSTISMAGEGAHTCAVITNGSVRCWGSNSDGQLGNGNIGDFSATQVVVSGFIGEAPPFAASVSAGGSQSCAMTTVGTVLCWGANDSGQIGDGTTIDKLTPVDVVGLTGGISAVSGGTVHTCALTTKGGVKCWGANDSGQIGDGTITQRLTPVDVVAQ
jgi:YVTN family beta-propeller protein